MKNWLFTARMPNLISSFSHSLAWKLLGDYGLNIVKSMMLNFYRILGVTQIPQWNRQPCTSIWYCKSVSLQEKNKESKVFLRLYRVILDLGSKQIWKILAFRLNRHSCFTICLSCSLIPFAKSVERNEEPLIWNGNYTIRKQTQHKSAGYQ